MRTASSTRRVPVFVVVPPRPLLLDIAGPIEVLRWANHVQDAVRFEVSYLAPLERLSAPLALPSPRSHRSRRVFLTMR